MTGKLSALERKLCAQFGTTETEYLAAKRARLAREGGVSTNAVAAPGRGHQVTDEATRRLSASGDLPDADDESIEAPELVAKAQDEIEEYLDDPDAENAWGLIASAAAYLDAALDRCAPPASSRPGADDEDDNGASDDDDGDDDAAQGDGALRNPFATHARPDDGSRTVRIVENGRARIERLSATEVAVCAQMGNSLEDYAKQRAARRRTAIG